MRIIKYSVIMTLGVVSLSALAGYGDAFEDGGFIQEDWQVVCDNTLTCRVAGYSEETSGWSAPASVLFTFEPLSALPTAQLQLYSESTELEEPHAELWLNNNNLGSLMRQEALIYTLNDSQTKALLGAARKNNKIEIRTKDSNWEISDKGMTAVLLKLDEAQGRVGTSIATVSKNSKHRQVPKAAIAKPVVKKTITYLQQDNKQLDASQLAYFERNIDTWVDINDARFIGDGDAFGECELINPQTEVAQNLGAANLQWTFTPIDAEHTLASHTCWRAAYNAGEGYWVIDHHNPSEPKLITMMGSFYQDGEIIAIHKGRGIGDCWGMTTWHWDGKTFAKTAESSTGLCRGFAGGAWSMPTYGADVVE